MPNNKYIGDNMRTLEKMKECVSKKGIDNISNFQYCEKTEIISLYN